MLNKLKLKSKPKLESKSNIPLLAIIIVVIEGLGYLSGYLGMSNRGLYETLIKPPFSPPGWVFPIVWTILYFLMAVAFYRILVKGKEGKDVKRAVKLFIIQLVLNLLWTPIFFRFNLYGLAFVELLLMLIFILLTTFEFFKIDKSAGFLMIPYVLWVSFAGILNFYIWVFNEM